MRKIFVIMAMFVTSFCFIGLVNADYSEGAWDKVNCLIKTSPDYADVIMDLEDSYYVNYSFNSSTGKYASSGSSYASLSDSERDAGVFYMAQDDTLFAYLVGTAAINSAGITDYGNNDVCLVSKTVKEGSSPAVDPDDQGGNSGNKNTEDEPEDLDENVYVDSDSEEYMDGNTKTSSNPDTALSDYMVYLLPVLLVGGSVLVFKRRLG